MTNIARGETGQADFVNSTSGISRLDGWMIDRVGTSYQASDTWDGGSGESDGWTATPSGEVSVPVHVVLGDYTLGTFRDDGSLYGKWDNYTFTVIDAPTPAKVCVQGTPETLAAQGYTNIVGPFNSQAECEGNCQ